MIKKTITIVLVLLFLFQSIALAADSESARDSELNKPKEKKKDPSKTPFFKALGQDIGHIFTSPGRIRGKDWLTIGGVALITGILIHNDEKIYQEFKQFQRKNEWADKFSGKVTKLGDGGFNLGVSGVFYLGGWLFKDKRAIDTAKLTLMTFVHTSLVVQFGKHMTGRQRPSWDNGKDYWHGPSGFFDRYKPYQISKYDAFPSGHTISIFGTATVVSEMYKDTVIVPIVSYSLATLCGLSRVTEDTHWLSDVFLGAVLGYAIGKYVVKRRSKYSKRRWNFYPTASSRGVSLGMTYTF